MCAQRQGTGSGQLGAALRQVDGGVTEKGRCDRVVENERRAVDDLMGRPQPRDAGGRSAGLPAGLGSPDQSSAAGSTLSNPGMESRHGHPPMPLR